MHSGTELTLSKFADDTRLSCWKEETCTSLGAAPMWTSWGSTRTRVMSHAWVGETFGVKYQLGNDEIESSPTEKDLGVWGCRRLDMIWQCVLAVQKANCVLGCIKGSLASRLGKVIFSLLLHSHGPQMEPAFSSGFLIQEKTWTCWSESRAGNKNYQRSGAPLLWRQTEWSGVVQSGE